MSSSLRGDIALAPSDAHLLSRLAGIVQCENPVGSALLYGRAHASSGRVALAAMARRILGMRVAFWHIVMLNDRRRNEAFAEAIRRSVGPDTSVLEIGVGSGLLSMVAAMAGARRVVGCEQSVPVAEAARRVVSRNRLADRIEIFACRSADLSVGKELSEPADLVLAELVSSDLLTEGIVPAIEDARRRLAKPGARIIPSGARLKAALVEMDALLARHYLPDRALGFDLGPFGDFAAPTMTLLPDSFPRRLSADFELFAFDFMGEPILPGNRAVEIAIERAGTVHGVLQWIELDLAPGVSYANRPSFAGEPSSWSHWPALFHNLYVPLPCGPGDRIVVEGQHNTTSLLIIPHGRR